VVRHISDRIAVMYLGRILELGAADELYHEPRHPYTAALLSAVPQAEAEGVVRRHRIVLPGDVPSPVNPPSGCPFHPRCPKARLISGSPDEVPEMCRTQVPELTPAGQGRLAACWYPLEPGDRLDRAAAA
jgi:oligopeptide/dipeptide ABC transporter ATP-binding protein